ncbi:stage III sporulation protein AG [Bacillus sp. DTU_2020_1000418_1_SI_GHA_SEK_038]|uniref:stage III sporulation protein AG n=1 Tax=Bacillus sp. DTU_2020_1000418_1_SI_GHA_SEK_038 TaxID=3077585 RepID=UPI0028E4177F|nr:stage III sporulation protein AG [Bacillus sp. DTU_2020_1000418_1_SI_GHA_SEK_038]WNS74184.1 stage III sporulation protein AG [Bacillus sp. DTU_2020_1000418_1_SI_GHA_SEK_038]
MDKDKGPLTLLKKWLSKDDQPDKKPGKYQYLLLVLLFGAAIMLISNMFFNDKSSNSNIPVMNNNQKTNEEEDIPAFGQKQKAGNDMIAAYERAYEAQLKEALDTIVGVDDVTVVVNVDATEAKVLEKNRTSKTQVTDETDREGGKRNVEDISNEEHLVITRRGEEEVPIVLETKKPKIRGVLVVAKGAENITVKGWIIEAVTRALDVPSHRVAVMPKKTKGE